MFEEILEYIRDVYQSDDFIPLHIPTISKIDKDYVSDCLNSTFVSSVGKYVDQFEQHISKFTGAKSSIATVNGTAALHAALSLKGVKQGDEVICQPFTFIATSNAISYCGANPVFVDIESKFLSLCPNKLDDFFKQNTKFKNGSCYNIATGKKISAVIIMHSFGMPGLVNEVLEVCKKNGVILVEDAAESLGSWVDGKHTGLIGDVGVLSFNGNKIITTGGGGMILFKNKEDGEKAKHLTTTAKLPHKWEYNHDMVGFNYRLPNLNAAMGVAQMEKINSFLKIKREIAIKYDNMISQMQKVSLFKEDENRKSNYWLNALIFDDPHDRDSFLEVSNNNGIMTRPPWGLLSEQKPYKHCFSGDLSVSREFASRIANIPSSVIGYED